MSWVDVEDYQHFLEDYAKARFYEPMRRTVTGEYKIENKNWDTSAAATQIYGTARMPAKAIFENLLNNRDIVVKDKITDVDGKEHYEINKKQTDLAQDKALKMKDAFKRWLWEKPERREKYVERYNNLFNSIVGRKFDGSHQTFPGMSPSIRLKPHQLDAVMRAKFGGNTLLAHCVGAGKSFEMVAATMEKKRLGLINKACVVVPKHLVGQMANEWLRLYPQAKILTASEKDFDKDHRQKFIGRCCTGDYDAVIMSYEQFENYSVNIESAKRDIEFAAAHQPSEDNFRVEIGGKVFTERKPAGEALQKAAIKFMAEASQTSHKPIGMFCGFELAIEKFHNGFNVSAGISLRKELTYNADMDISGDIGNVTRLENLFSKGLERKLNSMSDKLARMQTDLTEAVAAKGKPFEHAAELAEKSARLEQLNRELEVGKAEDVIMNDDEQEHDSPAQIEEITKSAPKQKR